MITVSHPPRYDLPSLLIGVFFYLAFWGLVHSETGMAIAFAGFSHSSAGEGYFWVASILLLLPGTFLIGSGISPLMWRWFSFWQAGIAGVSKRNFFAISIGIFGVAIFIYSICNTLILQGFPITDDEYGAMFGGQILAGGNIHIPAPKGFSVYPNLFLYLRDGMISSFDWPGLQVVWALSEITGTGNLIFWAVSAVFVGLVWHWSGKMLGGSGYAAIGVLITFFSPMFFFLSISTHGHVLSRTFVGFGIYFYYLAAFGKDPTKQLHWWLMGTFFGAGFFCRPIETAAIALPFVVHLITRSFFAKSLAPLLLSLAGVLPFIVAFALFNYKLTGNWYLPARFAPNELPWTLAKYNTIDAFRIWDVFTLRFGANISYNLLMLCIWFLGPLGIFVVWMGMRVNRFTQILGWAVGSSLFVGLLHENYGLHIVGPIHYSEVFVPLLFIAMFGVKKIYEELISKFVFAKNTLMGALCMVILGFSSFNLWHSLALYDSSKYQSELYRLIENPRYDGAVIVTPSFGNVWMNMVQPFSRRGTFVYEWRRNSPYLSVNDTVIAHAGPDTLEVIDAVFSKRPVYQLVLLKERPFVALVPIEKVIAE